MMTGIRALCSRQPPNVVGARREIRRPGSIRCIRGRVGLHEHGHCDRSLLSLARCAYHDGRKLRWAWGVQGAQMGEECRVQRPGSLTWCTKGRVGLHGHGHGDFAPSFIDTGAIVLSAVKRSSEISNMVITEYRVLPRSEIRAAICLGVLPWVFCLESRCASRQQPAGGQAQGQPGVWRCREGSSSPHENANLSSKALAQQERSCSN